MSSTNAAPMDARCLPDRLYDPVEVAGTAILHSMCSAGTQQMSSLCSHRNVRDGLWGCMKVTSCFSDTERTCPIHQRPSYKQAAFKCQVGDWLAVSAVLLAVAQLSLLQTKSISSPDTLLIVKPQVSKYLSSRYITDVFVFLRSMGT